MPRKTIPEDDVAPASNAYSASDGLRHKSGGRNALAAGGGYGFDWVDARVGEERPDRPDGVLRGLTVVLGLIALEHVPVSFVETIKATAPAFTVVEDDG